MNDSWTDNPIIEGLALIGDAAGYSDPRIGQGLSVALRDVRVLSELLATSEDWSPNALTPYTEERAERMRRLRFCNAVATTLRGEFGPEARERRRRAQRLMQTEPRPQPVAPRVPGRSGVGARVGLRRIDIYHRLCARAVGAGS